MATAKTKTRAQNEAGAQGLHANQVKRDALLERAIEAGKAAMVKRAEYEDLWRALHGYIEIAGPQLAEAYLGWYQSSKAFFDMFKEIEPGLTESVIPSDGSRRMQAQRLAEDLEKKGVDLDTVLSWPDLHHTLRRRYGVPDILDGLYVAALDLITEIAIYGRQLSEHERRNMDVRHTVGALVESRLGINKQHPHFPVRKVIQYRVRY